MNDPRVAASHFAFPGTIATVSLLGAGNVNDTFLVECLADGEPRRFVLQRLNPAVFGNPTGIMANLRILAAHIRPRLPLADASRWELPGIIPCRDGADCWHDQRGACWRALTYIEHTRSIEAVTGPEQAREAGRALGIFHALVHDLPPGHLHDPLPGFHVTPRYLAHYKTVAASPARPEQSEEALFCHRFIAERRHRVGILEEARERGEIQERVIHGDPKLANILFDAESGRAVSLIDLDTVKPGLIHYDLGDCLRSCCNLSGEETTPTAARFDASCFSALLTGYLPWAAGFLSQADLRLILDAAWLISLELGMRFFTDHLEGDVYFKTSEDGHNLRRACTQFHLCRSIEAQEASLRALVAGMGQP
ncbi:MAG: phosphotransferase enzyme family protein [Thermodesulfobacteriota bacterium]